MTPEQMQAEVEQFIEQQTQVILEKSAAFDRYIQALEDQGESFEAEFLKEATYMMDPGDCAIRKAAALDRIIEDLGGE